MPDPILSIICIFMKGLLLALTFSMNDAIKQSHTSSELLIIKRVIYLRGKTTDDHSKQQFSERKQETESSSQNGSQKQESIIAWFPLHFKL